MEATSNAMVSSLLLCLLLVSSGMMPCVLGAGDYCWELVHSWAWCKTAKCRRHCQAHGFVDGRCNGSFPYLVPCCECLRPNCNAAAAAASPLIPAD